MSDAKTRVRLPASQTSSQVDGLANVVSGLGTNKGKRAHNRFLPSLLNNYQELEAAYQDNWIARQIVDIPAGDMTREWRTIKSKGAEAIQNEEARLGLKFACEEALSWARLFGGGGILMLTNQDLGKPLNVNKIKKGNLERLLTFDRWEMQPQTLNTWDVLAPNYLMPEFYTVQGGTQMIHWTHFARFNGARLPRRLMAQTSGWGDSELRKCMEDLKDTISAKGGIAELMQEASIDIITRQGLSDELASDQDEAITDRYALFSQMKSIVNLALLDGEETFDRKTLQLSGVAQTLEVLMVWLSGCADIPATRLFGTAAKGLNATGEGDQTNYYDSTRAKQNSQLGQPLSYLDQVMVRSALGNFPSDYDYVWNPLKLPNQVEEGQAQLLRAQKDRIYLEDGIVKPSQVQKNLRANEEYQFEDGQIEETEENENADPFAIVDAAGSTFASIALDPKSALEIIDHLDKLGIKDAIDPRSLHVTLMYSASSPVSISPDQARVYDADIVGSPAIIGNDPWRALVVDLSSDEMTKRHQELKDAGGIHSYDEFRPHLSLKYSPTDEDLQKLKDNPLPEALKLRFSKETFNPVK